MPSETYVKYPKEYTFNGKQILNLGCGTSVYPTPNVVNLDAVEGNGVNVVHDLSITPLPFEKNRFDRIIANHVFEHIPNWWALMEESARILKPGGILEIWVPPVSSDSAFTYRDHCNRIGLLSFTGTYTGQNAGCNLVVAKQIKESGDVRLLALISHQKRPMVKWWLHFAPDWFLDWATTYLRNTVSEECFIFLKKDYAN